MRDIASSDHIAIPKEFDSGWGTLAAFSRMELILVTVVLAVAVYLTFRLGLGILLAILPLTAYFGRKVGDRRLLQLLASQNGWQYRSGETLSGTLLGDLKGNPTAQGEVAGSFKGREIRLFRYTQISKYENTHVWGLEMRFDRVLPHTFLDAGTKHIFVNDLRIALSNHHRIAYSSVGATLYAADQYENEALQLYSQEFLDELTQSKSDLDIETRDNRVIVYLAKDTQLVSELRNGFELLSKFQERLEDSMKRFSVPAIGDLPNTIKPTWLRRNWFVPVFVLFVVVLLLLQFAVSAS